MNEATFGRSVKRACKTLGVFYRKLADRSTHGIPDCVIIGHDRTVWVELKLLRGNDTVLDLISPIQLETLKRILHENGGHAWVAAKCDREILLYNPDDIDLRADEDTLKVEAVYRNELDLVRRLLA